MRSEQMGLRNAIPGLKIETWAPPDFGAHIFE
jgi:hypothetical protein